MVRDGSLHHSDSEEAACSRMTSDRRRMIIYVCLLKILACTLFFIGFFPYKPHISDVSSKTDLPTSVNGTWLNVEELYRRRYSKVIFMVIDALRYDFVTDEIRMPFLNSKLKNKTASCLISARAGVPTVTLPRIKAMTSGTVPGFLDVLFNFGSSQMLDDNVIHQAVGGGYKIVFYGDDTWLRLYPNVFNRSEGTPSFFVNDFYEVDHNVTRNMNKELYNLDWDIMILHYLGLDHIGHVEGPFGKSVTPKLREMDSVIERVMQNFDNKDDNILFVITGDHGMKDSGGHGGSSFEEVTVPVVLLNSKCDESSEDHAFDQVDLAPLLSALLGVPTPAGSTGKVSPKWLAGLNLNQSLYAAYYNTLRMKNHLLTTVDEEVEDELIRGMESLILFFTSSLSMDSSARIAKRAFSHLYNAQTKIVSMFARSNEINMLLLVPAVVFLFQAMALLFVDETTQIFSLSVAYLKKRPKSMLVFLTSIALLTKLASLSLDISCGSLSSHLAVGCLLAYNTVVLFSSKFTFKVLKQADELLLVLCGLLPVSYLSTSFIEEEYMYWYFTFATLVAWAARSDASSLKKFVVIAVLQRILKNLNYTGRPVGDNSSTYTDIGGWLRGTEHRCLHFKMAFFVIGLFLSSAANWKIGWSTSALDLIFVLLQGFVTLGYKFTINGMYFQKSSGVEEVSFFWILTLSRSAVAVYKLIRSANGNTSTSCKALTIITQLHMSIITLFMDLRNVILVPSLMLFSHLIRSSVKNPWLLVVFHYWLGEVFFFYMGNSNSIATIDVTVGFIGLGEFHLFLAVIYVAIHTYAFPILSYMMLTIELVKMRRNKTADRDHRHNVMSSMYLLLNGLPLACFMIVIVLHREHLFIWSVFSPKLLYLVVHSILVFILTISTIML